MSRSAELHRHQLRRHTDTPYAVHPFAVAFLLQAYTDDENIFAAALMHDVLEDVRGYEYEDLEKEFGKKIASIVQEVSEDRSPYATKKKDKSSWLHRKELYIKNLEGASEEALFVSAGDKIHNLYSLIKIHGQSGDKMWGSFHAPEPKVESTMWFYDQVIGVLKSRLDSDITKHLSGLYKQAKEQF